MFVWCVCVFIELHRTAQSGWYPSHSLPPALILLRVLYLYALCVCACVCVCVCVCVCIVCVCVFIKLHITTQSGLLILVILRHHSH